MLPTIAIIFGISKYPGNAFEPLPAAQIDALHFARALTHWGISDIALFLNEEATIANLNEWFASLARRIGDYKLVFYFCGHGQRVVGSVPSSDLLFFDGRLHLDSLISYICQSRAKASYIFIDACSLRINSLMNPKLEEEVKGHKVSYKSLFCLLSSGIEESFETNHYGYFTDALLKVLAASRKTEPDATQFLGEICKILKAKELPLPEMYNIGSHKISLLPPLPLFFNHNGLLYRSEMIAKIEDALIFNRGKIGVLVGEKGSGKTSLCQFLASEECKTFYVKIPHFSSASTDLSSFFQIHPSDPRFWGSLVLMDEGENLHAEQLSRFVEAAANTRIQFLLISDHSVEEKLPLSLRHNWFQITIDPFSFEEGEQLMLPHSSNEKERRLIHLVSKGNPLKIQQVAHGLDQSVIQGDGAEKEEIYKLMSALYGCGCFVEKELFAETFDLALPTIALFEELGLLRWEEEAWTPHPIFFEIAESESLSIQKEKILAYWYRQIKKTPNHIRAAENLILSLKCLGYEKKGDPYLYMAFKALYRDGKDHLGLFIDGAQIFQSLPEMTDASTFLAEVLVELKRSDWTEKLRQARPLRRHKKRLFCACSLFIAILLLFFIQSFQTIQPQIVNLKPIHPDFVGRDRYLHELHDICLKKSRTPPVAVLWGEGGIGKSEIAIAFANSYANSFRLVFWIDSETEESYAASYYILAKLLKIPEESEKDIVKQVHGYLEKEKSIQPWLLIYDNAVEKTELPLKGKGSVIITTRNRAPWQSSQCIEVAPFQQTEAIDLFKKITNNSETTEIHSLVKQLDFFPLTLNLAAHYIAETPEMNEELYLKLFSQNNIDLISSMPLDSRYPTPLLSSWNITADELAENAPEILQWLHFCSCLYPSGIPSSWVEKWLTDIQKRGDLFQAKIESGRILRILFNQSLMRFEKKSHTLSLHHLKQDVMKKDRYFQKEIIEQVAQFLIDNSGNIERIYERQKNLPQWENLREWEPHAAWFLNNYSSQCSQEKISALQNVLGNWKYIRGNYKSAQSYHQQALKSRIELFGEENEQTIISMNNLARILWENGQFTESKDLFTRSLSAMKQIYKEDHFEVITTLNNLGWVNWEMGQFQEARALLNQSLRLSKKLDGCDPDFLQTVNDFLQFFDDDANQQNMSETEKVAKRALFLRHVGLWIAEVEGSPTKSLGYFEESLELLKKVLPEDDPLIAIAYGSVGISLNRADRSEEAQKYLSTALDLQKRVLGEEHPDTAKSYANLAISWINLGKYEQALEHHQKGLEIRQKTLGDAHPVTAKSYSGVGNALISLKRAKEALFFHQKALEIRKKALGENHSETAQSYSRLGMNFGKLGQHEKALEYNLKASEILHKIFGENHYLTVKIHTTLGDCYRNLGQLEKGLYHHQKAEEIRKIL